MINILELLNEKVEFELPPQDLCLKCGKCCKTIISDLSNSKLATMAQNNEAEAKVFFNIFKPYESIEQAKQANAEHIEKIIEKFNKKKYIKTNLTFYYCPYLSEENLCTIYARRPECCKRAPINGWAFFPDGCGYEGWQFLQREKHKSRIRKLKEVLYELEVLADDDKKIVAGIAVGELKQKINEKIDEYKQFGVEKW